LSTSFQDSASFEPLKIKIRQGVSPVHESQKKQSRTISPFVCRETLMNGFSHRKMSQFALSHWLEVSRNYRVAALAWMIRLGVMKLRARLCGTHCTAARCDIWHSRAL